MRLLFPLLSAVLSISCTIASTLNLLKTLSELTLSPHARIHVRSQDGYAKLTKRWTNWQAPDVAAIVEVSTEQDVSETVRFANKHNIPFIAQTSGHGDIKSLGAVKDGLQINLSQLDSPTISEDGKFATIGGGIKGLKLRNELWEKNKWTVHGCCECPGFTGTVLGGGHGFLRGRHGLLSDQLLSLNLVLGNGTAITVSSTSHPELFWAMQGAGHNFGIVTSLEYKIYDIPDTEIGGRVWSYEILTYEATAENVKEVYGIAKNMVDDDTQPAGLALYGVVAVNPDVGMKPVIMQHILYNGPLSHLKPLTQPYHALSPIASISGEGTFLDVPRWIQVEEGSIPCDPSQVVPNPGLIRFTVNTKTYNLDALAMMVEEFTRLVTEHVEFAASFIMIEQWADQVVRSMDASKSVVPWREHSLLIAPTLLYPMDNASTTRDDFAWISGEKLRSFLVEGAKEMGGHYSYVNYAYGGESEVEMYGEENLKRLRELKIAYDPLNKFRFFAPITFDGTKASRKLRDEL